MFLVELMLPQLFLYFLQPRGLSRKEKAYSVPSTGADMERVSDDLEK